MMDSKIADARNFLDLNGLNQIRQQSNQTDKASKDAALKEAAQQFEAIFMQMLLKSMRSAQDVMESDSPFNSETTKFYRDMHDQQLAVELSSNGTLGLSELIIRQLGGGDDTYTPSSVLRTDNRPVTSRNTSPINDLVNRFMPESKTIESKSVLANKPFSEFLDPQSANQPTFEKPQDFVNAMTKPAMRVQDKLGVPFEVVIAQAALETGWGQKIIKTSEGHSSNNLFNIKADKRWQGDAALKNTLEFEQGELIKKKEPFRVYNSLEESINDYVSFLTSNDRYQEALAQPNNPNTFIKNLQKAGYATDPNYANKILSTLKTVTNLLGK